VDFSEKSRFQLLLWPGMKLMRALRFPAKVALIAAVTIVPLSWLTGQALLASHRDLESTRLEAAGGPLLTLTLAVAEQTQKHRGLVNRALAGDATVEAALGANRTALKAAVAALQSAVLSNPGFDLAPSWQPIRQVLERLAAGDVPKEAAESFRLHSEQVEALRHFMSRSAEASGLLLDPDAGPFHLMHLTVEPLVVWTEALGQLRGRGAALLRKGETSPTDRAEMVAQLRLLSQATASAEIIVGALGRAGEAAPAGFAEAIAQSREFSQRVETIFAAPTPTGDAAAYFEAGSKVIGLAGDMGRSTTQRLQGMLDARALRLQNLWFVQLAVGLGTVFGVAYLAMVFFRTSFGAMFALQRSVAQLTAGDFTSHVKLRGTDELSVVGQALDAMTGRLSELVADIRSNSTMVAQAGFSLAEDTKALSERTESQASSLEQTAASVQELSGAVRKNAQGAEEASAMAVRVRQIAEQGGSAIQSAVASMQDIQTSSKRVQEIVGVIEGISFQTNILALNAAVEAARAGEQGRGFAVVATEVRSLAQRSAASAREIKALIGASAEHVDTGSAQIGGASRTFAEIVQGIREVADSVHAIKNSTAEQSGGLDQIAQAVQHIDEITQRNAQMVESAFHSSSQLSERAERLAGAVASFRLRQGSADEALALVRKAVAVYKSDGAAALAKITDVASGMRDRDMYVFAFDRQGIYRAFAGNAAKVGTAVRDNPGVDGDKLVRDAFDQAARGGGWVDYDFANPQSGQVDLKTSYVEPVTPDLVLGCGVYKQRETASAAAPTTALASNVRQSGARAAAPKRPATARPLAA
jgi:methyl-accepting chemotaxis protein